MLKHTPIHLIQNIYQFRYILKCFEFKDLKEKYHSSFLGFVWTILTPLCLMAMYGIIFHYIFKVKIENYTLYLLSGIIPWIFFVGGLEQATHSLVHNYPLMNKIYFPREILPIAAINGHLIHFLISWTLFFGLIVFQGIPLSWNILTFPIIVLVQYALLMGFALCLSALMVFFRDVIFIAQLIFQILFFFCPIVYALTSVPDIYKPLYLLNPMAVLIGAYRNVLLYGQSPFDFYFYYVSIFSIFLLYVGFSFFKTNEWIYPERA